jgi:hypothetical protein
VKLPLQAHTEKYPPEGCGIAYILLSKQSATHTVYEPVPPEMVYLTHSHGPINGGIVGVGVGVPVGAIDVDGVIDGVVVIVEVTVGVGVPVGAIDVDGVIDGVVVIVEVTVGVGVEPAILVDGVKVGVEVTAGAEQHPVQIVVNVPPVKSTGIWTESVNAQNVVENPTLSTTKCIILSWPQLTSSQRV